MSLQDIINPTDAPAPDAAPATSKEPKAPMRSWRKKFRKLKLRFDKAMEESNALFLGEHKQHAISRRVQEENDNLLEVLLDFNERPQVRPRYDLGLPGDDHPGLKSRLHTPPRSKPADMHSLSLMLKTIPHTEFYSGIPLPNDVAGDKPPAYFDTAYEEEYLANLDAQLDESDAQGGDSLPSIRPPASRHLTSDKELMTSNPNSVISWLRRHHPETFLQEKDNAAASERSAPKPRGGATAANKRASLASAPAPVSTPGPKSELEGGAADDEAAHQQQQQHPADDAEKKPTGRSKKALAKNQDDDGAYRPKGGSSSRAGTKRKRNTDGDGDTPKGSGRGKRAKAAGGGAVVAVPSAD